MKLIPTRSALVCAVYVCLHLAAQVSARQFAISPGISVWYPPCGLALSLLVMLGLRYTPVVLLANVAGALIASSFPRWWGPIAFPAIITANYALVAAIIRRFIGRQLLPGGTSDTVFFSVAIVLAPLGAAFGGTYLVHHSLQLAGSIVAPATRWWLGDVSGLLTVVPVIMVFVAPWLEGKPHPLQRWSWDWRFLLLIAAHGAALLGSLWFVFSHGTALRYGALYLCFLPLIWTCLRYGLPGGTLATLVLVMGSLIGMHRAPEFPEASLFSFLLFELAVSVLGLGLGSAVSRRDEAQAELSASRAQFDRVIEGSKLGLWDWNVATDQVIYNRRCAEILYRSQVPLAASREAWDQAIHPNDRQRVREALQAHLRNDSALYESEYRIQTQDGRWRWIHSRGSVVQRTKTGEPLLVSGTHLDITDRKFVEAAAKRLLAIVETTTDFVLTINADGHVVHANTALLNLLGLPALGALQGKTFVAVFPPESAATLRDDVIPTAWAKGSSQGELRLRDAQHHDLLCSFVAIIHRDAEDDGSLLSFVMRDITAQKDAEAANLERERKILQVQKAESLSVLAGGIAHDFNNLLTAVLGNASLLREDLAVSDPQHGPLAQIEIAAGRAAELCNNMLTYAGRFHLALSEINLNNVVEESRELIQAAVHKKVTISTELSDPLPSIHGSAAQLQQAIINLALNANDAIGDQPGFIRLRTRYEEVRAGNLHSKSDGPGMPGHYVMLEVADSGCGMPEEVRTKIFEPFFTTKATGHGLGLSAVKGIVRAHSGLIQVDSTVGRGSAFRIWLPAMETTAPAAPLPEVSADEWRGSGLALVVDDEQVVRMVVARLCERLGFSVITANDGADGVTKFHEHHAELKFVLTDLTMPRMNGDEAMLEMRRVNPNVPILLMSGYPQKMAAEHYAAAKPAALLVKPLRLQVLRKTLGQVLQPE